MSNQSELSLTELGFDELLEHAADVEVPDEKWAGTLAGLVDMLAADFQRRGRAEEDAVNEAQRVVALIAQDFGGRPVYLPRGDRLKQALVARQIYHLHNGRNTDDLAQRFGYTVRHIQRIYAEQRAIEIRKRQAQLPI